MSYPFTPTQIHEFVRAPKTLRGDATLEVSRKGETGAVFHADLDIVRGTYVDLRYLGKATDISHPTSYDSALILAGHRVRGIGHHFVGRNNLRAKQRIPAGWHENRLNPALPTTHADFNRHAPLPQFAPIDFRDFINKCAQLWTIDLKTPEVLL